MIKLTFLVCELKLVFQFLCKSQIQEVIGPESRGKIKFLRFAVVKSEFWEINVGSRSVVNAIVLVRKQDGGITRLDREAE